MDDQTKQLIEHLKNLPEIEMPAEVKERLMEAIKRDLEQAHRDAAMIQRPPRKHEDNGDILFA